MLVGDTLLLNDQAYYKIDKRNATEFDFDCVLELWVSTHELAYYYFGVNDCVEQMVWIVGLLQIHETSDDG